MIMMPTPYNHYGAYGAHPSPSLLKNVRFGWGLLIADQRSLKAIVQDFYYGMILNQIVDIDSGQALKLCA